MSGQPYNSAPTIDPTPLLCLHLLKRDTLFTLGQQSVDLSRWPDQLILLACSFSVQNPEERRVGGRGR